MRETWSKSAPGPAREQLNSQWDRQMLIQQLRYQVNRGAQEREELVLPGGTWEAEEGAWKDAFGNKEGVLEEQCRQRKHRVKGWEVR